MWDFFAFTDQLYKCAMVRKVYGYFRKTLLLPLRSHGNISVLKQLIHLTGRHHPKTTERGQIHDLIGFT